MIDLKGFIAISGYPGLFKVVAQSKNGIIVESLIDKKRMNAFSHFKMSTLEDISIFTTGEDMPLAAVFHKIFTHEKGGKCIDGKASGAELTAYLNKVLPEFDKERVHNSDLKKLANWYNLLQENDMLKEVVEEKVEKKSKKKAEATTEESTEEKPKKAAKKTAAEKATAAAKPKKDVGTKAKSTAAPMRKTSTVRKTGA
jgi:chemotaxis protein histidine kinase CheA